eukprot:13063305-Alexandrium_andersonii.AAC.1
MPRWWLCPPHVAPLQPPFRPPRHGNATHSDHHSANRLDHPDIPNPTSTLSPLRPCLEAAPAHN